MSNNNWGHHAVPPPSQSSYTKKRGYSSMTSISQDAITVAGWSGNRKRTITEDEYVERYFDKEDVGESSSSGLAYIPAPDSPTGRAAPQNDDDDEEDDPLDAYMAGIERQVQNEQKTTGNTGGIRADIEEEDVEESYYRYMEENPMAGVLPTEEDPNLLDIEYDEDGNPIPPDKKRIIDPLPPIDHTLIEYKPFRKDFYCEHDEIKALSNTKSNELRRHFGIIVTGTNLPRPVSSFAHFNFDDKLLKAIIKAEYTSPTPIQAQGVPAALSGRDVLGIAQTGSGKTAAFLWPMMKHVAAQESAQEGQGPVALILAPTRELAIQIYTEANKFAKVYNLSVVCAYGGGSKWEQSLALKEGADIVVATPGRIIDHIKGGATNLQRVTFLVLDEADRMFELGFEPQVRSVCDHVRPDRQTLLFSATFRKRIEKLAKDSLQDPVRISQGITGQANEDVTQIAILVPSQQAKRIWLFTHLVRIASAGSVLIFVTKKIEAEQLAADLKVKEHECLLLHGDIEQAERNKVIMAFKRNDVPLMVATDVAARGLDIPHIRTVINFDLARDIDTHTHRIGRTGRAGQQGTAYTLLTAKDKEFAGHIVKNLEAANQHVPQDVMDLALESSWFAKQRKGGGTSTSQKPTIGGFGLGFKGAATTTTASSTARGGTTAPTTTVTSKSGPGTDRFAAMRAAFKSQYMNQFTASSDQPKATPPPPGGGNKKKSRWE